MAGLIKIVFTGIIVQLLFMCGCTVDPSSDRFDPENPEASMHAGVSFDPLDIEARLNPELLEPSKAPYVLGVGDVLEIEIAGLQGTRTTTFILPDGRIYFDLAGGVEAEGLTMTQLAERLEKNLQRDYTSPHVNINLTEVNSRRFWILGRVYNPGLYPLKKPTTLLEAISLAGGLFTSQFSGSTEELADLGNSFVMRNGEILPVDFEALLRKGDMRYNIYLRPDDYIYLPSALSQNVYVLGHVRQPQAVGYKDRLNLIGAISAAKGTIPGAYLEKVVIVRGSLQQPKVAVVNLEAVMKGQQRNVELRPFDIVWVPRDPWDKLNEYFWQIANVAARTIAVREGARAVDATSDRVPVIPIN